VQVVPDFWVNKSICVASYEVNISIIRLPTFVLRKRSGLRVNTGELAHNLSKQ